MNTNTALSDHFTSILNTKNLLAYWTHNNKEVRSLCCLVDKIINDYLLQLVMLDPKVSEYDLSKAFYKYFTNPAHISRFQELKEVFSETVGVKEYSTLIKPIFTFYNAEGKPKIDELYGQYY